MPLHTLKELDNTEGTVQWFAQTDQDRLILHPVPNPNDPNDPLRWPRWKKLVCYGNVCAFTFLTNFSIGGLAPAFYPISLQYNKTQAETANLLIYPILVLGLFNFLWVPLANYFGKRPVFVFASLLLAMAYLWGAVAKSFDSLLWSCIVAAFAGSSTEALGAAIVNDLFFLHERGAMMSLYVICIAGGNSIGPLLCGFITTGIGWRWQKWISFILTAVNFFGVVFFAPETRYNRPPAVPDLEPLSSSSQTRPADTEKAGATVKPSTHGEDSSLNEVPKHTWLQGLSVYSGTPKDANILKLVLRPLSLIVYPAVLFACLSYTISLASVITVNLTNPFVLQAPPYSWTAEIDGLINIPGFIGNAVGSFLGGWVVDKYSGWMSHKNGGLFRPEYRLHLLIIPGLVVPAGCLAYGYGVAESLSWVSLFFGYGMISLGLTMTPLIAMVYVSDTYYPINADALLVINGLKNIVAYGVLHGVNSWVSKGYVNAFGTLAGIYFFIMLMAIPLVVFGQTIRRVTSHWPIIL